MFFLTVIKNVAKGKSVRLSGPATLLPQELVNASDHTGGPMKAVRLHEFGGPEVLRYEDAPMPKLKTGEVLVKVFASALNPPDWYLRDGYRSLPPERQPKGDFPMIPGTDISGVVYTGKWQMVVKRKAGKFCLAGQKGFELTLPDFLQIYFTYQVANIY